MSGSRRWFRSASAAPSTAHALDCVWSATTTGLHHLVPDGCAELLWLPDRNGRGAMWVCGPDTRGWTIDVPPGTSTVGVRFRAGTAGSIIGTPLDELVDRRTRLEDLCGGAGERHLLEAVDAAGDAAAKLAMIEAWVAQRATDRERDPIDFAARALARRSSRSVDQLARDVGLSTRQFHRRFTAAVGYGPAFYARVSRLQRFMRLAARRPHGSLAAIAADAGYADQAHLSRDCRELAGCTASGLRHSVRDTSASLDDERVGVRSVQDLEPVVDRRWSA